MNQAQKRFVRLWTALLFRPRGASAVVFYNACLRSYHPARWHE